MIQSCIGKRVDFTKNEIKTWFILSVHTQNQITKEKNQPPQYNKA